MILPHPESNLSLNIMVLGVDVVKYLKRQKIFILAEDAMDKFLKADAKRTPEMFINTLSFLYTFGIIEKKGYKIRIKSNKAR